MHAPVENILNGLKYVAVEMQASKYGDGGEVSLDRDGQQTFTSPGR